MKQTLFFKNRVAVRSRASIVGKKEGAGPLGRRFDVVLDDDLLGQKSWELAESEMLRRAVCLCLERGGLDVGALELIAAGDLVKQIMPSSLMARALGRPFLGLYGACSTFAEGALIGGAMVEGGFRKNALCAASSHFCTAERQFRFPLELGTQRPPSAQWTATAAGAMLMDNGRSPAQARLTHGTIGRAVDFEVADANHMGAAMAPAVADTIQAHFIDTARDFSDYDRIITGDLGYIGRNLLKELLGQRGIEIDDEKLVDCGASLFYQEQDVHAGGSGCGCVAAVTCAVALDNLEKRTWQRVLVIGSGALMSTTSAQQGESIPGVAHAVALEADESWRCL